MLGPFWLAFTSLRRKPRERVPIHLLRQVAKPLHRPAVPSCLAILLESRGRVGAEYPEAQENCQQIRHRLLVRYVAIHMPAAEKDYMSEFVRDGCHQCERLLEQCAPKRDHYPISVSLRRTIANIHTGSVSAGFDMPVGSLAEFLGFVGKDLEL